MHIPEEFHERLQSVFGGRYRIRWSDARHEYHIEQKVRRAIAEGFVNVNPRNVEQRRLKHDDMIRGRDGYVLTMVVTPGTTTHCHVCNSPMKVPAFETAIITCDFCRSRGRYVKKVAGYYPLSDTLIDHLRKIDVLSDGQDRVNEAVNRHNEFLVFQNRMDLRRRVDAGVRDRFNRLVGIQQVGYTGKERMWEQ